MAYSQAVLRRAKARLAQEKAEFEADVANRLAAAYEKYPELEQIDRELRATMAHVVAASFRKGEDPTRAIAAIRDKNLELQRRREWILADYDDTLLEHTSICEHCGGSGYIGSQMCECLTELCRQEQKKELTALLGSGRERFDQFRLDYYPEAADPTFGVSPRHMMRMVLQRCQKYAREFSLESPSLLFTGGTGLGKTFLSGCIARCVADNGHSVVYDTAIRLFSDFEAVKFGDNTEENRRQVQKYMDCDLLIIDDLGTEMVTQFTVSALYQVINSRLMDRKPTILSTNLSPEEIRTRYSPQIASRILGTYHVMQFLGTDIRMRKNEGRV